MKTNPLSKEQVSAGQQTAELVLAQALLPAFSCLRLW